MQLPDDYGSSPVATLAHVATPPRAPNHTLFWNGWQQAVFAQTPRLGPRPGSESDPSDPSASHQFESVRHVGIGCTLVSPPKGVPLRAGLVATHGYDDPGPLGEEELHWKDLAARGVAVLAIRVRGYPGSQLETGNLTAGPAGWITHGLDAAPSASSSGGSGGGGSGQVEWALSYAVADTVNAYRALRAHLASSGGPRPVFLQGESFGAALAVLAAAQLAGHDEPARLVIGLPSFGEWSWRFEHRALGAGGEIHQFIVNHRHLEAQIVNTLRLFDTVIHARRVRCPVLCKLAERDEIVPAPTAAAVFNALAADPGLKWRFVTPYGHFDGGLRNARRHALFDRARDDFLDPRVSPAEAMGPWQKLLSSGERPPAPETNADTGASSAPTPSPPATGLLFDAGLAEPDADARLVEAYTRAARTLDDLPYTPEFERLCEAVGQPCRGQTARNLLHRLHNLRKAGKLPKLGRAATPPPRIEPDEERALGALITAATGTMGQRDQLPYTPAFDALVEKFNADTGRQLDPHDVWRLVAKLAK